MKELNLFIICSFFFSSSLAQGLLIKKSKVENIDKTIDSILYAHIDIPDAIKNSETSIEIIDTTGRYLVEDVMDGESSGYVFYSKDGKKLNDYRPYPFFTQFRHDANELHFVVAASADYSSHKLKIAWLNHNGELLQEKEIVKKDTFLRAVKVVNDRLIVVSHDIKHRFTIACYDYNLNKLWSKEIESFIHYSGVKVASQNNSLIIYTKEGIKSLSINNGEGNWFWSKDMFHPNEKSISLSGELIFEKKFMGVISYEMNFDENSKLAKVHNIHFSIFDLSNGKVVFHDAIEGTENVLPVVCKNPFSLDSTNAFIKLNDKAWRYTLVK